MLPNQKYLFEIPENITYLNCAYLSPQLRSVSEAGISGIRQKEQPWTITPPDFFENSEKARSLFARIIDAAADDIAIIPSVSYGIGVAAKNINVQPGQKIVLLHEQFPSNVYPWRELARTCNAEIETVQRPANDDWTTALLEKIDGQTAAVAAPNCHWTDGSLVDLAAIRRRCDAVGAALVVDATQSLGAMPFSIKKVRPDFLIAAGYKWLLGPYSLGYLYVAPKHHGGQPLEYNWLNRENSEDFAGLVNYRDEFQHGARRFDMGERSNFTLMPMAVAALQQINEWQVEQIYETLSGLTGQIAERAKKLGLSVAPAKFHAGHLIGIRFPGGVPAALIEQLKAEKIFVSVRGNSIRIAPHLYNSETDVEKLFSVFERFK